MLNTVIQAIYDTFKVSTREAWLYLVLSACGWGYFLYSYVFASGLGAVLPKYAGY
jgi:uncharacterized protein (DUF58 family)